MPVSALRVPQYQAPQPCPAGGPPVADAVLEAALFTATRADVVQREDARVASSAFHMRDRPCRQQVER